MPNKPPVDAGAVTLWVYTAIGVCTFIFLMFFDGYTYTWWNWPIAVATSWFLSLIWPIYWILQIWM